MGGVGPPYGCQAKRSEGLVAVEREGASEATRRLSLTTGRVALHTAN